MRKFARTRKNSSRRWRRNDPSVLEMKIITGTLKLDELKRMAAERFGDMAKAVVDVEQGILAVDAELHSDLEAKLLENGSEQKDLWGINLYPDMAGSDFIEYDSMINLRPGQGNRTRSVDDAGLRGKIAAIVMKKVAR